MPRETVDLRPYNNKLQELCHTYATEFVQNYENFLLASGELPESYFLRDKVHINNYGTKKLLKNIDKVHRITRQSPSYVSNKPALNKPVGKYQHGSVPNSGAHGRAKGYQHSPKYCHICKKKGHNTQGCWFNGRNDNWSGWQPW